MHQETPTPPRAAVEPSGARRAAHVSTPLVPGQKSPAKPLVSKTLPTTPLFLILCEDSASTPSPKLNVLKTLRSPCQKKSFTQICARGRKSPGPYGRRRDATDPCRDSRPRLSGGPAFGPLWVCQLRATKRHKPKHLLFIFAYLYIHPCA